MSKFGLKGNFAVKIVAYILTIIFAIGTVAGLLGTVVVASVRLSYSIPEEALSKEFIYNGINNYAAYLISSLDINEDELPYLSEDTVTTIDKFNEEFVGEIEINLVSKFDAITEDIYQSVDDEYSSIEVYDDGSGVIRSRLYGSEEGYDRTDEGIVSSTVVYDSSEDSYYYYISNLWELILGRATVYGEDYVVYNYSTDNTDSEVDIAEDGNATDVTALSTEIEVVLYASVSDYEAEANEKLSDFGVKSISDIGLFNSFKIFNEVSKISSNMNFDYGRQDVLWVVPAIVAIYQVANHYVIGITVVSMIGLVASIIFLLSLAGYGKDGELRLLFTDKIYYIFALVLTGVIVAGGIALNAGLVVLFYNSTLGFYEFIALSIVAAVLWIYVGILLLTSTATRIKLRCFWRYTLAGSIVRGITNVFNAVGGSVPGNVKVITYIIASLTFDFILALAAFTDNDGTFLMVLLWFAIIIQIFVGIHLWNAIKKLLVAIQVFASGNYSYRVNESRFPNIFRRQAAMINAVGEGIEGEVSERMQSERLKTDLITNVSHDIKTPLTSIINYVDLIKKSEAYEEEIADYVEVLDRQSAKLKKLIEDLIEASKASSGVLEVHMAECDLALLMEQSLAEYDDRLRNKGLEVVYNRAGEEFTTISTDPRHIARAIDNLISNANKYSLEGTRIYVDVIGYTEGVSINIRNISAEGLNISADELMERFVRGDSSRNTSGYGLGLSIARSLVDLVGGKLTINIDGDLFKVNIWLAR